MKTGGFIKKGTGSLQSRRLHMVPWYPELVTPNPKSGFADSIVEFLQEEVMSTELYDGIFYDSLWDNGGVDWNIKNTEITPSDYREGIAEILKRTREIFGANCIILGNPCVEWRENRPYWNYANGHYQENALGDVFGSDWDQMWKIYQRNMKKRSPPSRVHWIGVDTQYKRDRSQYQHVTQANLAPEDLRRMRLGLGTRLLLDSGYFGFDKGDGWHGHGEQWWFPEYEADLGLPKKKYEQLENGICKRAFENGIVVVNPTGSQKIVQTDGRNKDMTSGESGDEFRIPARDARIILEI